MISRFQLTSAHSIEVDDIVRLGRAFTCYKVVAVEKGKDKVNLHMDNGSEWSFDLYDEIECRVPPKTYDFNDEAIYAHEQEAV